VCCRVFDTRRHCTLPRTFRRAGTYGSPVAVLTFVTQPDGAVQPPMQHLRIQGIADLDNDDGPVPVEVVCTTAVGGPAAAPTDTTARVTWVPSSAGIVVRNR
jgi:hypothetical protein